MDGKRDRSGLYTERQRRAAQLLVDGLSQAAAFRECYSTQWCKDATTLRVKASAFFRQPKMRTLVEKLQAESLRRCNVTQDRLTRDLAAVAFAVLPDLVETRPDGTLALKPVERLTTAQRTAVKKLKLRTRTFAREDGTETVQETEVELHGKLEAIHMLGLQLGMFSTKVVHEIPTLDYRPDAARTEGRDGG